MKYKYFGTAAAEGIPALYCECDVCARARALGGKNIMSRSQSLIDDKILIDYPPDTFMHTLQGLPLPKIHTYIITHDHSDHLYPKDFEMAKPGFAHQKEMLPIDIYCAGAGCRHINSVVKAYNLGGRIRLHKIKPFDVFEAEGYKITAIEANHASESDPVIYLIEKDGKCILHSNDTGYYPEKTWEYLKKHPVHIDFASFDCTETEVMPENNKKGNHMNYVTVLNVIDRLRALGCIDSSTKCAVNHFSHNGGLVWNELSKKAKKDGLLVSFDGMEIEI